MIDPSDDFRAGFRWLGLGAAAFLVGCSAPPAPIVHVTVVIPPPAVESPQRANTGLGGASAVLEAAAERPVNAPGDWPESGWRVIVCPMAVARSFNSCLPEGPALEFIEQCYDLAKTVRERRPEARSVECHWVPVVPQERDLSGGVT